MMRKKCTPQMNMNSQNCNTFAITLIIISQIFAIILLILLFTPPFTHETRDYTISCVHPFQLKCMFPNNTQQNIELLDIKKTVPPLNDSVEH